MIIDSHAHLGNISGTSDGDFKENTKTLVGKMNAAGISHAVVIAYFENLESTPNTETVLSLVKNFNVFTVVGSISMVSPNTDDLQTLETLLKENLISGIKLYPGYEHVYPYNKKCFPVYELALKHNKPVIFHSGDTLAWKDGPPAKVKYAHPLHIDDVATDFPDLKIIIAHVGNPWIMDCAEVLYKNEGVYADVSGLVTSEADFKSDYGKITKKRIKHLIAYAGSEKLLFGTDYPLSDPGPYISFVKSLRLRGVANDQIFYKNARELFNIQV